MSDFIKLDMNTVRENFRFYKPKERKAMLASQQIVVYVMIGGGMIGRFGAEQPGDFYIDSRVSKRPYTLRKIYQAVQVLLVMAQECGYSGKGSDMPKMPNFHCSGVF